MKRGGPAAAIAVVAVVLGLYGGAIAAVRSTLPGPQTAMPLAGADAPPLDLTTVTASVAGQYRYAGDHADHFSDIPCYCGCDAFLGHRSLADCFVRADGAGWDVHAAGCAICLAEAADARRMFERGRDPAAVRGAIVDTYGPADPTTST